MIYHAITGRAFDLSNLNSTESKFLIKVCEKFKGMPNWSEFANWWIKEFDESNLEDKGLIYRICQDLEARLGIAQGKVSPPDYRDYLMDLIEVEYGSIYKFCKETGIDKGQLSRVFAGRADLSLRALQELLPKLGAILTIQKEADLKANIRPENASCELANIA